MAELAKNPILVIAKNIGALTAANLIGRLLNFVIVAIVARNAGAEGLGGYATANAVAGFFLIFADIGLGPRLVREASADAACTPDVYANSLGIKTLTSLFCLALLALLYFVLPYEPWVRDLSLLTAASWVIRSYTQMNVSVVRARERMELEAVSVMVQTVVFIGGSLICLYLDLSLVSLGWTAILAAVAQLVVSSLLTRQFTPLRIGRRPDVETMVDAAPYAATLLAFVAFAQSNVVVLSLIASQVMVGEFTSVSRILLLASVVPQLITLAIVPASARVFGQDDPARFRRLTTASLRLLMILAGAGAVALVAISQFVMRLVYGAELERLYPYLQVGTLYLVFQFASTTLGTTLTAAGRQGRRASAIVIAVVASVGLFVALVPPFGVIGAVMALILAELVLVVAEIIPAWDLLDQRALFRSLAWVALASAASVAAHFALAAGGHALLAALVPVAIYPLALWPSGEFRDLFELVKYRR